MTEDSTGQKAAEVALKTATSVGAVAGGLAGGPPGALAGVAAKEVLDAAGSRLIEKIWERRRERAAQVMAVGAAQSNASIDRFSETIESSPELLALLSETVQAAMETPLESKIYALGGCLGRGVRDGTRVDAERLRVRGLARIENPEVELMALLDEEPGFIPADEQNEGTEPTRWLGWRRSEILEALPGFVDVLDACIARLMAEGLAIDAGVGTWGGGGVGREQWALTAFGKDCLRLLQAVTPNPAV
ncbi:hypothetical protein OG426_26030 [Streptomyces canus]|uniref:hypothetical protein n=1 Tax=Streptomyces canus TaxID=58343 RepID=UPI00386405B4|nr:hypothetical protein OG426_26030 [Streptomyces canus]